MSNETAYQHVKRYINKQWELRKRYISQDAYAAEMAEKDGALQFLKKLHSAGTPLNQEQPGSLEEE